MKSGELSSSVIKIIIGEDYVRRKRKGAHQGGTNRIDSSFPLKYDTLCTYLLSAEPYPLPCAYLQRHLYTYHSLQYLLASFQVNRPYKIYQFWEVIPQIISVERDSEEYAKHAQFHDQTVYLNTTSM